WRSRALARAESRLRARRTQRRGGCRIAESSRLPRGSAQSRALYCLTRRITGFRVHLVMQKLVSTDCSDAQSRARRMNRQTPAYAPEPVPFVSAAPLTRATPRALVLLALLVVVLLGITAGCGPPV